MISCRSKTEVSQKRYTFNSLDNLHTNSELEKLTSKKELHIQWIRSSDPSPSAQLMAMLQPSQQLPTAASHPMTSLTPPVNDDTPARPPGCCLLFRFHPILRNNLVQPLPLRLRLCFFFGKCTLTFACLVLVFDALYFALNLRVHLPRFN